MQKFIITENDAGQRLDKYLTKKFPYMPMGILYKGIRKKRIKVNGKRAEGSVFLNAGDLLELYINDEFLAQKGKNADLKDVKIALDILYEDENLILINKKEGISVHADETSNAPDLVSQLKAYLIQKGEFNPDDDTTFSPALCNRLDKNTGGIVIGAKNAKTLRLINEKIRNNEITKKYLCVAEGILEPKTSVLTAYHKKDDKLNKVYIFDISHADTKQIQTEYTVLKEKDNKSLVEINLITGRTHQIRAHLAHIGHPLLGDKKYNPNSHSGYKHQALYAYKLKFLFDEPCHLDYLNGKEFVVDSVPFTKDF